MPLRVIKGMLDEDPDRALALVELEDRIIERALEQRETARVSPAEVRRRYELPENVLDRLAEIGVLTPTARGYDADDVAIIEAMVALPRRRLRRGARLHRLRHAALPRGAAAARRGGDPHAAGAARRRGRARARGRDHRLGRRAAARAARRDALQAAAGRAAPPGRRSAERWTGTCPPPRPFDGGAVLALPRRARDPGRRGVDGDTYRRTFALPDGPPSWR